MSFYDEGKYGVVTRTWFGLTNKMGGQSSAALGPVSGSATSETIVTRWYPKGPIEVVKVGWLVVATASAAANATGASDRARIPIEFYKSNANGTARSTLIASDGLKIHPIANTLSPLWSIASKETIASAVVESGRFITIFAATAESNAGTAAAAVGTTLVSGSFAFFVDWIPKFDANWSTLR
jgi:hypothetical protein